MERITGKYQTKLDKLLSVFEQTNFIDNNKITKQFKHETDLEEVKIITDILHYTGTDPEEKKKIEIEQEAWRTINAMFEDKEKELLKEIGENKKVIAEKDKALDEMARQLEELKRRLGEK